MRTMMPPLSAYRSKRYDAILKSGTSRRALTTDRLETKPTVYVERSRFKKRSDGALIVSVSSSTERIVV